MEELIAIVSVGAALAALIIAQSRSLRRDFFARMDRMEAQSKALRVRIGDLRERMANLEGLLEGLREAITRTRMA